MTFLRDIPHKALEAASNAVHEAECGLFMDSNPSARDHATVKALAALEAALPILLAELNYLLAANAWDEGEAAGLNNYEQPEDGEYETNPYTSRLPTLTSQQLDTISERPRRSSLKTPTGVEEL